MSLKTDYFIIDDATNLGLSKIHDGETELIYNNAAVGDELAINWTKTSILRNNFNNATKTTIPTPPPFSDITLTRKANAIGNLTTTTNNGGDNALIRLQKHNDARNLTKYGPMENTEICIRNRFNLCKTLTLHHYIQNTPLSYRRQYTR